MEKLFQATQSKADELLSYCSSVRLSKIIDGKT